MQINILTVNLRYLEITIKSENFEMSFAVAQWHRIYSLRPILTIVLALFIPIKKKIIIF